MDEWSLTFKNPETEREYSETKARRHLHADALVLGLVLTGTAISCLKYVFKTGDFVPAVSTFFASCYYSWELGRRRGLSIDELVEKRARFVVRCRTVLVCNHMVVGAHAAGSMWPNFFTICLLIGVWVSVTATVFLPLKFRHHLPYHILFSLLLLFSSAKAPCLITMNTPNFTPFVIPLAQGLDQFSDRMFALLYNCVGVASSSKGWGSTCPCLHVSVWSHFFVLGMVVSYAIWVSERRARLGFIKALPLQRQREEKLQLVGETPGALYGMHVVALAVGCGVVWRLSLLLVPLIEAWGVNFVHVS